jgi:hypothetical protein
MRTTYTLQIVCRFSYTQTDRQTDRQTDTHTHKHKHTHTHTGLLIGKIVQHTLIRVFAGNANRTLGGACGAGTATDTQPGHRA